MRYLQGLSNRLLLATPYPGEAPSSHSNILNEHPPARIPVNARLRLFTGVVPRAWGGRGRHFCVGGRLETKHRWGERDHSVWLWVYMCQGDQNKKKGLRVFWRLSCGFH